MDVIKITPEVLRGAARLFRIEAARQGLCDQVMQATGVGIAEDFDALADKLEADKREALEFIPAKGVQS
jgi:hypothetical protein